MLNQVDIYTESPGDGVADVPFAHAYPELFEHKSGQVTPLYRAGVAKEPLCHPEFLPLRPLPFGGRHTFEPPVDVEEFEFLDEERGLFFLCQEFLDRKPHVACSVDRLNNGLALHPCNVGHGVVEEVWTHAEFSGAPVGEDPAHDEPDEDGEVGLVKPGEDGGDLFDHLQASGDSFKVFADAGELQKLHTHIPSVVTFPVGRINPSVRFCMIDVVVIPKPY